jgi:hypothetical protein
MYKTPVTVITHDIDFANKMLSEGQYFSIGYSNIIEAQVSTGTIPDMSFIRERTILKPGVPDTTTASGLTSVYDFMQSTQYFDGLGRPVQTVAMQQSPLQHDMVSFNVYDPFGREATKYMPYTATTTDGNFKPTFQGDQDQFNNAQFPGQQFYFSQTNFEPSPLNRVMASDPPGMSWVGAQRGVGQQYLLNQATDSVQIWNISLTAGSLPTNGGGTQASPILISGNEFRNGSDSNQSGGITVGDYGGGYITVENNTLVNTGHFGIGVAGGTNVNVLNNTIYIRPLSNPPPNYYPVVSGIYIWGQEGVACSDIDLEGNAVDYDHTPGEGIGYDNSHQATCDSVTVLNNNWDAVLGTGILPARLLCPLLMGYYKFNANWNDASGNGLTATSHGTAYAGQGEDAMCANFDGVQDYLTLTNSPWLEPNSQRITVSCWIKPWKLQGNQGIAQSQDADGYNTGWRMILLDSTFDARIVTSNGPVDVYCAGLTQGAWTQLTMTYDGFNLKAYVNGMLQGSTAITGNVAYNGSGSPMMLGNCDGTNYYFDGYMDEFKFYDGNRNDSEILADYNTSSPLVNNPPPEIRAYYSFDGNWSDNSGNGLTAIPSNTTFVCDGDNSSSANFNGSNSSITLPQSPLLDPFSATLTVSCWIKPANLNGIQGLVQSQNGDGYSSGWRMSLSGSNFNPRVVTNEGPIDLYCPGLMAGVWNFVAMTYDGTSIKGYVNGVLQGSAAWGGYIPDNADLAMLMGYCNGSTYYFNGHMDEFKFYDGALTASQLQIDYDNTYSLINATPNCTLPTGGTSTNLFSQESAGVSKDTTQNATGTNGYTITPNPASSEIRISVSSAGPSSGQYNFSSLRVELYNTAGQLIKVKTGTAPEMNLIVADLSEGVYYLRIVSPVDMTTKKVMIIR